MNKYEQATETVMSYLTEKHYCKTIIEANVVCFCRLKEFLLQEELDYTPQIASDWYDSICESLRKQTRSCYRMALLRLQDVFCEGRIDPDHETKHLRAYPRLSSGLRASLDEFLESQRSTCSESTLDGYKHSCARFLIYCQGAGIQEISEITHTIIVQFYRDDIHPGKFGKSNLNGKVPGMLRYFYEKGVFPYGFTLLFHYLSLGKGEYWNCIPESVHGSIRELIGSGNTCDSDKLLGYQSFIIQLHKENGYRKSVQIAHKKAIDLLYLFLEMNGYPYSPSIALLWFSSFSEAFPQEKDSFRRTLCLAAQYHETSAIDLESFFRIKPCAFDLLPEWSYKTALDYVEMKRAEGWARSTLDMIRSSVVRFCNYLNSIGLQSFRELTASHVKQFNTQDLHKTQAGKNAYNTRIRKFLIYLGDKGFLENPMLFVSLSCNHAPKETIVVVLSESEMTQLDQAIHSRDSVLTLRKKAILLLGLKMGLRSSDIVNLKYTDINWPEASIRFIQKKTEVEVNLPMPTEVGNALFRYITEERGIKASPSIFLSEKAPHKPVQSTVCRNALKTALPDRNVPGSGFHVTRKTYATNLLRNGVGADIVAEVLGQRGTSSVHRYLSLDEGRMRLCALDLKSGGIGGWRND